MPNLLARLDLATALPPDWYAALLPLIVTKRDQQHIDGLQEFLAHEVASGAAIVPPSDQIFAAFQRTPVEQVRVVMLGQDPYHGDGQAMGLAFAVPRGVDIPPSLRNIYLELQADLGIDPPKHGDLTGWSDQGVLLMNTCLTVRRGEAGSHANHGWEALTSAALGAISRRKTPTVFVLWGRRAQAHAHQINSDRHLVLEAPHPSPLAAHRGFFGSRPFSRANEFLERAGRASVDWALPA
jgi:uracil-DNA glycosylase